MFAATTSDPTERGLVAVPTPQAEPQPPERRLSAPTWTTEEEAALKASIGPKLTDPQFRVFMAAARHLGLDPFARQIVPIKQGDSVTPQVTIDGFRLISERTGQYAGMVGPFWCGKDGVWHDVWLDDGPPVAAKVGVRRRDFPEITWGVARFKSYNKGGTWAQMPDVMTAKVAEAFARRIAFPQDLSGAYIEEELGIVEADPTPAREPTRPVAQVTIQAEAPEGDYPGDTELEPVPTAGEVRQWAAQHGVHPRHVAAAMEKYGGDCAIVMGRMRAYVAARDAATKAEAEARSAQAEAEQRIVDDTAPAPEGARYFAEEEPTEAEPAPAHSWGDCQQYSASHGISKAEYSRLLRENAQAGPDALYAALESYIAGVLAAVEDEAEAEAEDAATRQHEAAQATDEIPNDLRKVGTGKGRH